VFSLMRASNSWVGSGYESHIIAQSMPATFIIYLLDTLQNTAVSIIAEKLVCLVPCNSVSTIS
jgi:hypothetical protein